MRQYYKYNTYYMYIVNKNFYQQYTFTVVNDLGFRIRDLAF